MYKITLSSILVVLASVAIFGCLQPALADTNPTIQPTAFGLNINQAQDWPALSFGTLRLWDDGTNWRDVEPSEGVYNWTALDIWVNEAQKQGVELVYTFGRTPAWASHSGSEAAPPSNISYWDDFVTALVTRYKGRIKYYEGWDEPDNTRMWTGSVQQLTDLQEDAYKIIKSIDPNAQVLAPAPVLTPSAFLRQFFADGGGDYADIISFHAYTTPEHPELIWKINDIHNIMHQFYQEHKPVWVTEGGWGKDTNLPDLQLQAPFLAKDYLVLLSNGIDRFIWYGWDYKDFDTLWDSTNGIHPAGVAYQNVEKALVGATLSGPCSEDKYSTWTCDLTLANGAPALIVWNSAQNLDYYPPSGYNKLWTLLGISSPVYGVVQIGNSPILIEKTK